jgi:hypothetical protein
MGMKNKKGLKIKRNVVCHCPGIFWDNVSSVKCQKSPARTPVGKSAAKAKLLFKILKRLGLFGCIEF